MLTAAVKEPTGSTFRMEPKGPFSWSQAFDFFHHFRPISRHAGDAPILRLAFILDGSMRPVAVALRWLDGGLAGEVVGAGALSSEEVDAAAAQVARIFSLDVDATDYPAVADRDPALRPAFDAFPGLRPVLFLSPYECAVWGVLSQRISGTQASAIQDRLAKTYGTKFEIAGGEAWALPEPRRLIEIDAVAGLPDVKLRRLHGVARAALDGTLDAARLRGLGEARARELLETIPGIGPFWSAGIYLRACGVADALAPEPLSIAALGILHGLGERPSQEDLVRISEAYKPYRMWVTFLVRVAAGRGIIPGIKGEETRIRRARS